MRWIIATAACALGCSSSAPAARVKCKDVAACTAACAPCRTGTCNQTAGWHCEKLGKLHLRGEAPQFDLAAAAAAFEAGCQSYAPACVSLALQVQDGRGVPYDPARAIELYQRGCDQGAGVGCFNIAAMYEGGVGVPRDEAKAKALFARAEKLYLGECEVDPGWCSNIGYLYVLGLVDGKADPARAAPIYRAGCDRGDVDSCVGLAGLEIHGDGVPANRDAGVARLERACDAGGAIACATLASETDPDVVNPEKTIGLLTKACDGGNARACGALGAVYAEGRSMAADPARAGALFERSCQLGNSNGCMLAGDRLRTTDPGIAASFFELACHIGEAHGCMTNAILVKEGQIPGDTRPWLEQACRQGMPEACELAKRQP